MDESFTGTALGAPEAEDEAMTAFPRLVRSLFPAEDRFPRGREKPNSSIKIAVAKYKALSEWI